MTNRTGIEGLRALITEAAGFYDQIPAGNLQDRGPAGGLFGHRLIEAVQLLETLPTSDTVETATDASYTPFEEDTMTPFEYYGCPSGSSDALRMQRSKGVVL